jgi:hypothetical protein
LEIKDESMEMLAEACRWLEASMVRMSKVQWEAQCMASSKELVVHEEREVEDVMVNAGDERVNHLWSPSGYGLG